HVTGLGLPTRSCRIAARRQIVEGKALGFQHPAHLDECELVGWIKCVRLPVCVVSSVVVFLFGQAVATLNQHNGGAHQGALEMELVFDIGWAFGYSEGEF